MHDFQGGQFKDPQPHSSDGGQVGMKRAFSNSSGSSGGSGNNKKNDSGSSLPAELEGFDKELVDKIMSDILDHGQAVKFSDISGLDFAKKCVTEIICW